MPHLNREDRKTVRNLQYLKQLERKKRMGLTDPLGMPLNGSEQPNQQQQLVFQVIMPFYSGVLHDLLLVDRVRPEDSDPTFPPITTPKEVTDTAWEISRLSLRRFGIELKRETGDV
jgi:hypothetical protein